MPYVVPLGEQIHRFSAKTAPDRVGSRYEAAKSIAIARYIDNHAPFAAIVDLVKDILASKGVPSGMYGIYIAFAEQLLKKAQKHTGETLDKIVLGLKQKFVAKGADPEILNLIAKLVP